MGLRNVIVVTTIICLIQALVVPGQLLGDTTTTSSPLQVTRALIVKLIFWKSPIGDSKTTIEPKPGEIFVAILLSLREGQLQLKEMDVLLTDSAGGRYLPFGIAPTSLIYFVPFDVLIKGGVTKKTMDGDIVELLRDKEGDPIQMTLAGSDTHYIFVYRVPAGRTELRLTVLNSPSVPITPRSQW